MDGPTTEDNSAGPLKPGDTISPRNTEVPASVPEPKPAPVATETVQPTTVDSADSTSLAAPAVDASGIQTDQPPSPLPNPNYQTPEAAQPLFRPNQNNNASSSGFTPASEQFEPTAQPADVSYWQGDPAEAISWTASEYVAHHKSSGWYMLLMLGAVVAAMLAWLLTKDVVSTIVIIVAGAVLATYAARKPRQLDYRLDNGSLNIGGKNYNLHDFRSFSVVPEGAFNSIVFAPLKRFGMLTTIYYDPQDEDRIVDILSRSLPHEDRRADAIDGLMRRIRF